VGLRWYHGRVGDLAASVTFWFLVSLPATVLALLAALGPVDRIFSFLTRRWTNGNGIELQSQIESEVLEFMDRVLTDESGEITDTVASLFEQSNPELLTFSVALTIWSISRGFAGLIRAMEDIYDIPADNRRPWYITRVVAVILGVGTVLVPVPLIVLDQVLWPSVGGGAMIDGLRNFSLVTVLILWASILYHYGPATRHRWLYDLPGAVVAAVLWWILTAGFQQYVDLFTQAEGPDEVRAAVGAFLLALTWVWLAAQVLLIGGAVNFLLGERLGISRDRREWSIPDMVTRSTGELKRIMNSDRDQSEAKNGERGGHRNGHHPTDAPPTPPTPTDANPVARDGGGTAA
jgi:membrane protein